VRRLAGAGRLAGLAALCAAAVLPRREASARSQVELAYPAEDLWSTSVRFIRVDQEFPIKERDQDAGYILFQFVDGEKKFKGALELLPFEDAQGRSATRVVVNLPDLPRHFEGLFLDKLTRKIKDERGSPTPAPSRKPDPAKKKERTRDRGKSDAEASAQESGDDDGKSENGKDTSGKDTHKKDNDKSGDGSGNGKDGDDGLPRAPTLKDLPRTK
jgi:hypothetical protein